MSGTNLHVYPSNFTAETRILKITKTLATRGIFDRIYIAALGEPGLPSNEQLDDRREVVRLRPPVSPTGRGSLIKVASYLMWMGAIIRRFRREPLSCVNCHSLSVLPIGVWFKLTRGARLVYDTHELETETVGSRGLRRVFARLGERLLIHAVDAVVVVSPSIADWYRKAYHLTNVWLVRNIPGRAARSSERSDHLRAALNIGPDALVFLYQGVLGEGRGIELLLQAFARVDGNRHLVFLGYGPLEELIRNQTATHPAIHFHPPFHRLRWER